MKYGAKFCGGCNPKYDRGNLLQRISETFKDEIKFEYAKENQIYDGLIVFCGCTNRCATYNNIQTKSDPIIIWNEIQYTDLLDALRANNNRSFVFCLDY